MDSTTPDRLPVVPSGLLQHVRIESPCHADWSAMRGDEVSRHCEECQLSVLNLSRLPRDRAEEALANRGARLCVRMTVDATGRVLTAEDLATRRRAVRPAARPVHWWMRAASWLLLALGGAGLAACVDRSAAPPAQPPIDQAQDPTPVPEMMGEVCVPEEIPGITAVEPPAEQVPAAGELELMGDVCVPAGELMGRVGPAPEPKAEDGPQD